MGATTELLTNQKAVIVGPTKLTGKTVRATDLRAGASLVIAGLNNGIKRKSKNK